MIYPSNFEEKTGFAAVRDALGRLCTFAIGREEVAQIAFSSDLEHISLRLREAGEMMELMGNEQWQFPRCNYYDVREALQRIRIEGFYLSEPELFDLQRALSAAGTLTAYFRKADERQFPTLKALAASVAEVDEALRLTARVLDPYGRLKDNASPELARLRQEMRQVQGSVGRVLGSILKKAQAEGMVDMDVTPTLREGRLVIPISPQYKRQLGGIVHDESASGKTVYVEPAQVVEANNHIRQLESAEKREVVRILREVTDALRPLIPRIMQAELFLGKMDCLQAVARWADDMEAVCPRLSGEPVIDWQGAVHPLLRQSLRRQQKEVVPLDLTLNRSRRIVLISGPNAGGKSVCLKTVALLQYMVQCGLPIPVSDTSVAGVFEHLFIDIGDEQSIENDLSTYSSHLINMKYFVRHANPRTLLLIDEMGSGTEPQLGGAIAQATLKRLNSDCRAFGVVTTHYSNLKHFAEDAEGVVNGAMLYDRQNLRPLFQLEIGHPGSSFAIEIARKTGLPESLIADAVDLAGSDAVDYDKHLQDIARDKRYWQDKRQKIHQQEKQLEERIRDYDQQMADLRQKRREVLQQAREESVQLLQQSHAVVENTIRHIKEANAEAEATKRARQKMQNYEQNLQRSADNGQRRIQRSRKPAGEPVPVVVGGYARISGQQTVGQVLELNGRKAVVIMGGLKTTVDVQKLEGVSANEYKRSQPQRTGQSAAVASEEVRQRKLHFKHDLDVRGLRGDEAVQAVAYFVDDAIMVDAGTVRILHGTGNGILRQLIRQYLHTVPGVSSYRDEHVQFGGAGITVVELG